MDDAQLKKILQQDRPAPDENARKRAVNLALAEFEVAKNTPKKTFQGMSVWSRLTGRSNQHPRREKMNTKLVYGGMATAMVVVLAAGVTFNQTAIRRDVAAPVQMADPLKAWPEAQEEKTADAAVAPSQVRVSEPAKSDSRNSPERFRRVEAEKNSDLAAVESAVAQGGAALPVPEGKRKSMTSSREMAVGAMAPAMPAGIMVMDEMPMVRQQYVGQDKFEDFKENGITLVKDTPVSTFSADVDTSSYAFIRRQLNAGVLPQKDAVRVEEMVNYFDYDYALPENKAQPFRPSVTVTPSPWNEGRKIVHIGIKGYDVAKAEAPRSNLVFLLDTSGSMNEPDKLPLLVSSLKMLLDSLKPDDHVAIVTYAGSAGTVLEPTAVSEKAKILAALDNLSAGGSTAGAEGIRQAYALAGANFDKNAVNRVILATDGDFNVGITNPEELQDFVEQKRKSGIFLSVFGFGQGNYNDALMQKLAQNGNGVAAYIDTLNEARKVLVEEASSTLFPIAKDVKIQVEFNPATVAEYRLVGYETRHLNREDFNNDAVDAGDIGAGHAVTALYEITPVGGPRAVDDSRYAAKPEEHKADTNPGSEYAFLKIRYKLPDGDTSKLITTPISAANEKPFANTACPPDARCMVASDFGASDDVRFGVAVAGFGQLLKGGTFTGTLTYDTVIEQAQAAKGSDPFGYRAEFINMVRLAKTAQAMPDTQP